MTSALKKAFDLASRLSEPEQDALAAAVLDELAAEARWERRLRDTSSALEQLADEALAEHRRGETQPLDPEKL